MSVDSGTSGQTPHTSIRIRPVREVTAKEENFRIEPLGQGDPNDPHTPKFIKRDMVKPEPEGTIIMMAFVVTGYNRDVDGSALARLEHVDHAGRNTGWVVTSMGLYPGSCWVIDNLDDLPK